MFDIMLIYGPVFPFAVNTKEDEEVRKKKKKKAVVRVPVCSQLSGTLKGFTNSQ